MIILSKDSCAITSIENTTSNPNKIVFFPKQFKTGIRRTSTDRKSLIVFIMSTLLHHKIITVYI